jgi:RNA polymerase primary sigma factor
MTNINERERNQAASNRTNSNNLVFYLKEINRFPLLSREEEIEIAKAASEGNKAAREKLVNANLRFVVNIAKRYQGLGLPLEDLISEGNVGLVTAVDRFDLEKNCRFISYAIWWIRQAILSALCEKSRMIRLPTNRAAELVKIEKARNFVKKQSNPEEEIAEIAHLLNKDIDYVSKLHNISREIISLDNPVSQYHDSMLKDVIEDSQYTAPDEIAEQNAMEIDIENILETLNEDEADIIRCHYGLGRRKPMSLKEIGARYHLSKERIRQIEVRALSRLKNPIRKKRLQAYVA